MVAWPVTACETIWPAASYPYERVSLPPVLLVPMVLVTRPAASRVSAKLASGVSPPQAVSACATVISRPAAS